MIAAPEDSRYLPLTQQYSCCVPTCIQMVMYKNRIPLLPAEEIGYHLGLVVSPAEAHLFYKVRVSDTPPPAGYGTQIAKPEFEPNQAFSKLKIPLSFKVKPFADISTPQELLKELSEVEKEDIDVLMCFNHGALTDDDKDWGHVCVFDRVIEGKLRIVDPSPNQPKWRLVTAEKMFQAMKKHSATTAAAGLWILEPKPAEV